MFYQAALAVKPCNLIVLNNMAIIFYQQGNPSEALRRLELALRSPPLNVVLHTNLATAWLANGNRAKAIEHYRLALEINHREAPAHFLLGKVLQQQGNLELAIAHYEEAREGVPDYPRLGLLDHRIDIPRDKGKLAEMIDAALEEALKLRDAALSNSGVLPDMRETGDSAGFGA
jgi:tetratricopeptide (TPR) repeat protein